MPIIDVSLLSGRSEKTLQRLIGALHDATADVLGAPPESIRVLVREVPPERWASGGVTMARRLGAAAREGIARDEAVDANGGVGDGRG